MAFYVVRKYNQETHVLENFLRLECVHSARMDVNMINVGFVMNATVVETNCKKSRMLDGDLEYLEPFDLDSCIDLPYRFNCLFEFVYEPDAAGTNKQFIRLGQSKCLKI